MTSYAKDWVWPLKANPGLAATFCEYRPRHFHGGIDIKTWGARSLPCLAVDDGRVSRVKVQANGYGKALYLTTLDGRTAVYAHLDKFAPVVAERVRAVQEATGNFEVDLFWEGDSATFFKQGEIVAFSGVTGTTQPHLHFEVRDAAQGPMNPLRHGLSIVDSIPPVPVGLVVTPLDARSTVEGDCQPRIYSRLLRNQGGYFALGDPIGVTGKVGIAIDCYDQTSSAPNEVAAAHIELDVNGETYWTTDYERFDFSQTRCIEIERDYRIMRHGKGIYQRLYHLPGNRLKMLTGDGVIEAGLSDKFPIEVVIKVSDVNGNVSKVKVTLVSDQIEDSTRDVAGAPLLSANGWSKRERGEVGADWFDGYIRLAAPPGVTRFVFAGAELDTIQAVEAGGGVQIPWVPSKVTQGTTKVDALSSSGRKVASRLFELTRTSSERTTVLASDDSVMVVEVPPDGLYDEEWLTIDREEGMDATGQIESVYRLDPRDQPVAGSMRVKLRRSPEMMNQSGWAVYYFSARLGWTFLGADEEGEYLCGNATTIDRYALVRDAVPPSVSISLPKGTETRDHCPEFAAVIKDNQAGVTSSGIVLHIDGRKVPIEWDAPRARAYYRPWKPLASGKHKFDFDVTDKVGNTFHRTMNITIN